MTLEPPRAESPKLGTLNTCRESSVLEADTDKSDSDNNSETLDLKSLTSSIVDYEFENGRRYHAYKAGCYPLPNDESELDRLDLQHHVVTLLLDGEYHLSPLRNPTQILDLGTGTGLWAMEMADKFPSAKVTGVDLSPVQPTWVPDNVTFEIDDIESEWLYPENHFDLIHSRIMIGAIAGWKEMIARSFTHCKPGGYLEIQELDPRLASDDGSVAHSPHHDELLKLIVEASEKYGKPVPVSTSYKPWLEEAGFVDVKEYFFKIPCNSWPKDPRLKEVGKYQCLNYHEGYEAIGIGLLTRVLGYTYAEFSVFLAKVRKELVNRSLHTYHQFAVVIGRKPFPHEVAAKQQSSMSLEADTDLDITEENPLFIEVQPATSHGPIDTATEISNDESATKNENASLPAKPQSSSHGQGSASSANVTEQPQAVEQAAGLGSDSAHASSKLNEFPARPTPRNAY